MVCISGGEDKGDCRRRNVVYKTECRECKEEQGEASKVKEKRDTLYIGETSRTAYERGKEHQRDAQSKSEKSHVHNHREEIHQGEEGKGFSMKVLRGHRSALARQIHEAVLIANSQSENLLNSKTEYNRCIIPRLAVMVGSKEKYGDTDTEAEEREAMDLEEEVRCKKRDSRGSNQPRAKRRRRWREEPKLKVEKRYANAHPEGVRRYEKRRRVGSLGKYEEKDTGGEAKRERDTGRDFLPVQEIQRKGRYKVRSIIEAFRSLEERKLAEKSEKPEKCMPETEQDIQSVAQLSQVRPRDLTLSMKENVKKNVSNFKSNQMQDKVTPKIEKLRKNAQSGVKSSPTRSKLKKDAKLPDIRKFFEKKLEKNCAEWRRQAPAPIEKGGISRLLTTENQQQQPSVELHLLNSQSKPRLAMGGLSQNSNTCRNSPAGPANLSSTQDRTTQETGLLKLKDSISHSSQDQDGDYFLNETDRRTTGRDF